MTDKQIRPEVQAYSDAIMKVREIALELKNAVLQCSHKRIIMQTLMMNDEGSKMMGMDLGEVEMFEFDIAGTYGKARHMHELAREVGRRLNEPMPNNPSYDPEYAGLYTGSVNIRLSAPSRR